jgi:hypothetical protein
MCITGTVVLAVGSVVVVVVPIIVVVRGNLIGET